MPIFGSSPVDINRLNTLLEANAEGQICPGSASTSMTGYGLAAGATLTTDNTRTRSGDNISRYYEQVSTAVAGNNLGWASADQICRMDTPSFHSFLLYFNSISNIRFFFGLGASSTLGGYIDADTLSTLGFGIQFSTGRGDTSLQLVSWNGTTQTTTATGFLPTINTPYLFRMQIVSATNVAVSAYTAAGVMLFTSTITATLPASTTTLYSLFCAEPRSAATQTIRTYFYRIRTNSFTTL